ncbi:unnamed protein product, partial [Protopolystoma xenopodis]
FQPLSKKSVTFASAVASADRHVASRIDWYLLLQTRNRRNGPSEPCVRASNNEPPLDPAIVQTTNSTTPPAAHSPSSASIRLLGPRDLSESTAVAETPACRASLPASERSRLSRSGHGSTGSGGTRADRRLSSVEPDRTRLQDNLHLPASVGIDTGTFDRQKGSKSTNLPILGEPVLHFYPHSSPLFRHFCDLSLSPFPGLSFLSLTKSPERLLQRACLRKWHPPVWRH